MQLRLILNGKHGADQAVREAVMGLRKQGHQLSVRVTWEAGDAERLAQEAAQQGIQRVIAGGGDGTVNEVLNGLLAGQAEATPALAVLPLGTANDFASACGIPMEAAAALELAATGHCRRIDLGQADGRYFLNVASCGMGARITAETPAPLKQLFGGGAYVLQGLLSVARRDHRRVRFRGPDWESEQTLTVGVVANSRLAGGGFAVAPQARLDDGLLDVLVVGEFPLSEAETVRAELQNPIADGNRYVMYWQTPWVSVEVLDGREEHFNMDGEQRTLKRIDFQVVPQGLALVVPDTVPANLLAADQSEE